MSRHTVNIELSASGGTKVAGEMGKVGKASTDLVVNVKKLGNVFGELGGNVGGLISNILKGGIWGVMAEVTRGVVSLGKKAWDTLKKAKEEAKEAQLRIFDTQSKGYANLAAAIKNVAAAREESIKSASDSYKKELDAVHDLTRANLELARAQARARGDASAVSSIDAKIDEEDAATRRNQLVRNIADAQKRLDAANKEEKDAREHLGRVDVGMRTLRAQRPRTNLNDEDTRSRYDAINKNLRSLSKTRNDLQKTIADADKKGDDAYKEMKNAQRALTAFDLREQAKRENAEADAREKEAEEVRKFEAEKKRLEEGIAKERKALEADVAKERERLEKAAHERRMADIRKEIAAQKEVASVLTSRASAAQSEFDRAFAMYRDPSRAAAEIGEEKDYQSDLDRLHRDARRYGGKWRIDELSRLMSAGDTQGVTDALNTWRKTKGFTPEVEAMVRASAAEQTKTTAEEELRKVNDKVASMGETLKEMSAAQAGKLGAIADSTSGLSAKLDQLLKVKG